jgi:hypothetical protein
MDGSKQQQCATVVPITPQCFGDKRSKGYGRLLWFLLNRDRIDNGPDRATQTWWSDGEKNLARFNFHHFSGVHILENEDTISPAAAFGVRRKRRVFFER